MDLSENGKCLFTSLQYVESSHAPYQRIRFFMFQLTKYIPAKFQLSRFYPDGLRQIFDLFSRKIQEFLKKSSK
jgi:hypothetical protein